MEIFISLIKRINDLGILIKSKKKALTIMIRTISDIYNNFKKIYFVFYFSELAVLQFFVFLLYV